MRVCLFRHSRQKRGKAIPAPLTRPKPRRPQGAAAPRRPASRRVGRSSPASDTIGATRAHSGRVPPGRDVETGRHHGAEHDGEEARRERPAAVRAAARAAGLRRLRPGVPQRRAAGRDRGRAPARVRQQRPDPVPPAPDGAQRLPRRAVAGRPRPALAVRLGPRSRSSPRSCRSTPRSRATCSPGRSRSPSRPPTTSPSAASGCAARRTRRWSATPPTPRYAAPARYLEVNGTRHPLQPPGLVVGRGTEADLRINDPGVSRRHVEFTVDESADGGVGDRGAGPRLHQRHARRRPPHHQHPPPGRLGGPGRADDADGALVEEDADV